jgi:tRNA threonylcarbamoyladenosine biosynthesis protein TsaB
MKLLAIETATEACSAAIFVGGVIHQRLRVAPQEHSRLILPMIDSLLAEARIRVAELDGLAFSRGPGSFTGVRIGAGVVQGIALATHLPVVPVSTLAALAMRVAGRPGMRGALAALDARMGEVYWGAYELRSSGQLALLGAERVCAPEKVPVPERGRWVGVGNGWAAYREVLGARLGDAIAAVEPLRCPAAREVALLGVEGLRAGRVVPAEQALPIYLRDRVARKPSPPR